MALTEGISNKKTDKIKFLQKILQDLRKKDITKKPKYGWNGKLPGFKKDLRPHQKIGSSWLVDRILDSMLKF